MTRSESEFYNQTQEVYTVSASLCGNHNEVCQSLKIDTSETVVGSSSKLEMDSSESENVDQVRLAMTKAVLSQEVYGTGVGGKSVTLYQVLPEMNGAKSLLGKAKYNVYGELPIEALDEGFLHVTTDDGSTFEVHSDCLRIEREDN